MRKDDLISLLTSAGIEIPDGATVAILTDLATANGISLTAAPDSPLGNAAGPAAGSFIASVSAAAEEIPQYDIDAMAELQAMKPAEAPAGISEDEISEKTAAGLDRRQAIEVIERQRDWDRLNAPRRTIRK